MRIKELFHPLPGNRYLEVTTHIDDISKLLSDMLQQVGGYLSIALYANEAKLQEIEAKIQHLSDTKTLFKAMPREYDTILLKDIFADFEDKEGMLLLAYRSLANAGYIVILEKKDSIDVKSVLKLLEEFEFRAPNEIDIVEGYDLIIAKKMHMWGNGL
ncbi:MAG: hypothetical protein QG559_1793 [Campylobacterota bacterium]|nr:hypothetical protein [Campylobacterota bacterium]